MSADDKKPPSPALPAPATTQTSAATPAAFPPGYKKFHESLSAELRAKRDQVFNLIGDANWGEVGRHREAILKKVIEDHLPKNMSLGTGFVIGRAGITTQIDIIVYDDDVPTLFRQDDFIVVPPDGVRAIIEVKSQHGPADIRDSATKASINGHKILFGHQDRTFELFNGIFAYEPTSDSGTAYLDSYAEGVQNAISEIEKVPYVQHGLQLLQNHVDPSTLVNHVCFNERFFLKWDVTRFNRDKGAFKAFDMGGLSTSAFIFSLMLCLWNNASQKAKELYFPYDYDRSIRALAVRTLASKATAPDVTKG